MKAEIFTKECQDEGGWVAYVAFSFIQEFARTEAEAKAQLIKRLHLRV